MSWHYNQHDGTSVIQDLIDLLDDTRFMTIYTEDDSFFVYEKDNIDIGKNAMVISSDNRINLINTEYITNIELVKVKDNKQLNDSEEEI